LNGSGVKNSRVNLYALVWIWIFAPTQDLIQNAVQKENDVLSSKLYVRGKY